MLHILWLNKLYFNLVIPEVFNRGSYVGANLFACSWFIDDKKGE